ncbi:hypothetical protein Y032_0191g1330 [Ancylostoma ceylanicum]|uniref:Uncharacterized protein n=1 Tax=Ancylostoma ceylanicum TaxID=53326 RepID=A0A016SQR5_9BILA|nr:hypothetical protein Y032_0191g1330 [Ancylostoma ceylanicum]
MQNIAGSLPRPPEGDRGGRRETQPNFRKMQFFREKVIAWKVGGDVVPAYEPTKRCQEQGVAVHANGADLIIIEGNATQVVGHVIEAFTGKHRFKIHFLVDV